MIMFAMKHSCFGGVSAVKFVQQFLNNINEIASGVNNAEKDVTSFDLWPSAHDLVTQRRVGHLLFRIIVHYSGLRPVLEFILGQMISYTLRRKAINPYYQRHPPLKLDEIPYDSLQRTDTMTFSEKETKSIIKACRDNRCTVTGAILAAIHLAFYQLTGDKYSKFSLETAIPFHNRPYCQPKAPYEYIGLFAYFSNYYLKYSQNIREDFWMMAKESTSQLKDIVENQKFVKEISLLSALSPILLVRSNCTKSAYLTSSSNVVSSFGRFSFEDLHVSNSMTYKLKNCYIFPFSPGVNSVFGHFLYTINGKLTWNIVSDKTLPDAHAQYFIDLCSQILLTNCSTNSTVV
ncbi:uncharacterized protein LOC124455732 [Xenia sp. Carnegie-2017]|uniref:uncharacterized protein LOC124455732 n=1 Tax=Xenia sp. Carnegie-2017 TaxID=2897299 RepID=UPI001F0432E7|nr:uncharacterized protein LOC124455732 [Xenia sp. Carnegie-2017]